MNEAQEENRRCRSILVVEDEPGIRETLKLSLELEGYNVFTAVNGREGVAMLPAIPKPCLILLDLMMPVMNGWEFVEAIERDVIFASIPVVVVTAFADRAKTIHSKEIIKKPVDLEVLYRTVRKWCSANE